MESEKLEAQTLINSHGLTKALEIAQKEADNFNKLASESKNEIEDTYNVSMREYWDNVVAYINIEIFGE